MGLSPPLPIQFVLLQDTGTEISLILESSAGTTLDIDKQPANFIRSLQALGFKITAGGKVNLPSRFGFLHFQQDDAAIIVVKW